MVCLTLHDRVELSTHRKNMIVIPVWVSEVQKGEHGYEKVQTKLEDLKIWSTHHCDNS